MKRLTIFAKGNSDVRDALHAHRDGERVLWNGVNEVLRHRHPTWRARVRHETCTRSDALLAADGRVPETLGVFDPPAHPPEGQFSAAVFGASADVVVLSIQPDVTMRLARHRQAGFLFYPGPAVSWSVAARQQLAAFDDAGLLDPEGSMANFARIVGRIRQRGDPAILVFNLSPVVPGEWVHTHAGLEEALGTRIRAFNLALAGLSARAGVSIVDVDTVVARHGADRLKLDAVRLTAEGSRLVAEEVVRILADRGCLDG